MTAFRVTVPGNLLLAGEYAVLEEGGLGAALALEPRLTVTAFPSDRWEIQGRWTGGGEHWIPELGAEPPFAGLVFQKALEQLESRGDERQRRWSRRLPCARIEVDSSAFFDAQGRKKGFGSSAALAVGITAALCRLQERETDSEALQVAIAAHRHAQGGAGSGYDVTVSWYGGLGLFVGGNRPQWEARSSAILPPLAVFSGPEAIRTVSSIGRYRAWKLEAPRPAREFLEASNAAVSSLLSSRERTKFKQAWGDCKALGLELGRAIGSDAALPVPDGLDPLCLVKALGAGNETGIAADFDATFPNPLPPGVTALCASSEGLRWE